MMLSITIYFFISFGDEVSAIQISIQELSMHIISRGVVFWWNIDIHAMPDFGLKCSLG